MWCGYFMDVVDDVPDFPAEADILSKCFDSDDSDAAVRIAPDVDCTPAPWLLPVAVLEVIKHAFQTPVMTKATKERYACVPETHTYNPPSFDHQRHTEHFHDAYWNELIVYTQSQDTGWYCAISKDESQTTEDILDIWNLSQTHRKRTGHSGRACPGCKLVDVMHALWAGGRPTRHNIL